MKHLQILSLYLVSALWAGHPSANAFELSSENTRELTIVLPEEPLEVVAYAAQELKDHLATSMPLAITLRKESEYQPDRHRPAIHLGQTQAAKALKLIGEDLRANGYALQVEPDRLFIAGRDTEGLPLAPMTSAGTLFGVYDLLETYFGVRWFWPGALGTAIPAQERVVLPAQARTVHNTALLFSQWRAIHAGLGRVDQAVARWQVAEAAEDYYQKQAVWLRRHRFGTGVDPRLTGTDLRVFHSFLRLWEKYGNERPEFFNLLPNGKREEHPGRGRQGQGITLCVSQPDLWKQIVADWRGSWRGRMGTHILLGENDSPALCTCEACRSWDAPDPRFESSSYWGQGMLHAEGSPFRIDEVIGHGVKWGWQGKLGDDPAPSVSDRYARFYLEVQREARRYQPDVKVVGFAYLNYWKAPRQPITLNENIILSFVPPTRVPYTQALSDEIRENWDGWRQTGARLYFRPNLPLAHNLPVFYGRRIADDLAHFGENGMIGNDYDSLTRGHFGTQGPSLYAIARRNTLPSLDSQAILEEYYLFFGSAHQQIQAYFDHWEQLGEKEVDLDLGIELLGVVGNEQIRAVDLAAIPNWMRLSHATFTPQAMATGGDLLRAAEQAAAGDEQAQARVAYLSSAFEDAALTLQMIRTFIADQQAGGNDADARAALENAYQAAMQHRADIEWQMIGDFSERYRMEEPIRKVLGR